MSDLSNTSLDLVPMTGSSNRVTIPATPFQIRGGTSTGGATSVPCKKVWMSCPSTNTTEVRVTIGTDCTNTTGIKIPEQSTETDIYLHLAIDDLNRLYFYGATENDVVDILYTK